MLSLLVVVKFKFVNPNPSTIKEKALILWMHSKYIHKIKFKSQCRKVPGDQGKGRKQRSVEIAPSSNVYSLNKVIQDISTENKLTLILYNISYKYIAI